MTLSGLNRAPDESRRGEGAHRVVDEHDVRLRYSEGLEPGENALLTSRASDRGRPKSLPCACRQTLDRLIVKLAIVSVYHDCYRQERKAGGKRLERMHDKRTAGAIEILLWPISAEPHTSAASDDQEPNLIRRQLRPPTIGRDAFSCAEGAASMRDAKIGGLTWLQSTPFNRIEPILEIRPCR
jgi:hypothetical protein